MKACGCAASFVAGLALPRMRVSGIEDPRRPEGIWPFAWHVAKDRIGNEREIALVMNPKTARSQQLMHVHILRFRLGERAHVDALPAGVETDGAVTLSLVNLHAVFAAAIATVGAERIGDHGILVMRAPTSGFRAVITDRTSPQSFTLNDCH